MSTPTCVRCERSTPDGFACHLCVFDARAQLDEIAHLAADARESAHGLARHGSNGSSGKPGSRPPGDLAAMERLDAVQNALTTIVREIADTRGAEIDSEGLEDRGVSDPIEVAAKWLSDQMEWVRHATDDQGGAYAVGVLAEIAWCARIVRSIADSPGGWIYLGPCGATVLTPEPREPGTPASEECKADIQARPGAKAARCRTCGAEHDVADRRRANEKLTRGRAYRASEIADAYQINVNTIRSWALERPEERAKNGNVIRKGRPAKLREHGRDLLGRPLYLLGDVLNLAAAAVKRRAESQTRRALLEDAGQSVQ